MKKVICLLAFRSDWIREGECIIESNDMYLGYTHHFIQRVQNETNLDIILLTDEPHFFNTIRPIEIITPNRNFLGYTDKMTVCEYALTKYDTTIFIDSNKFQRIDFKILESTEFSEGIHFHEYWKTPESIKLPIENWNWKTIEKFTEINKDLRYSYFVKLENYCINNNLEYLDTILSNEKILILRKNTNLYFDNFFIIYNKLKKILEENDIEFNNKPIGRGEGLAISIAAKNSNVKIIKLDDNINFMHGKWYIIE